MKVKGLRWWIIGLIALATIINYIDLNALVSNGSILTEDRDSTLSFKVIAVHDQVTGFLVIPEYFCAD